MGSLPQRLGLGLDHHPLALGEVLFHPGRSFEEPGVPNEALGRWEQGLLEEWLLNVHLPFLARTLYCVAGKSTKHFKKLSSAFEYETWYQPLIFTGNFISRWLCTSITVEISHFLVLSACVSRVESLDNSEVCRRKNLIFVSKHTF